MIFYCFMGYISALIYYLLLLLLAVWTAVRLKTAGDVIRWIAAAMRPFAGATRYRIVSYSDNAACSGERNRFGVTDWKTLDVVWDDVGSMNAKLPIDACFSENRIVQWWDQGLRYNAKAKAKNLTFKAKAKDSYHWHCVPKIGKYGSMNAANVDEQSTSEWPLLTNLATQASAARPITFNYTVARLHDKKLCYRRRTARRAVSVEILFTASTTVGTRGPIYKISYDLS